jgi:hypothetical protein
MHKRIGLIAGGAAVALAAVAGCTSSSTNTAGSNGSSSGGNGGSAVNLSPAAFVKAALTKASNDGTVHVTGSITAAGTNGTMTADESFGNPVELSMTMNASASSISEILIGDKLYAKVPELSSMLGGKSWVLFDLNALGSLGSTFQSLINSAKNMNPAQQLQPLLASGNLHKVGSETVDGVQADHYSGTVDPATAFDGSEAAKNLTADQITQLKALMKAGGVTTETIDLWVASDGLPVRVSVNSNSSEGAVKVDMHLSDWGKPVSITAPPADQVGDMSSLLGGILGASSTPSS